MKEVIFVNKKIDEKIIAKQQYGQITCQICLVNMEKTNFWWIDMNDEYCYKYCNTCFDYLENRLKSLDGWKKEKDNRATPLL